MINFKRRGPKSAEEKRNIKQGLKKFWDKRGRAVMAVGGVAAAGALASKSMLVKSRGSLSNVSVGSGPKLLKGKNPGLLGPGVSSSSVIVPGSTAPTKSAAQVIGGAAGRTYGSGKATGKAFAQGLQEAKAVELNPNSRAGQAGRAAARFLNSRKKRK